MKNYFDLQLFAEVAAGDSASNSENAEIESTNKENESNENGESKEAAKAKYTDEDVDRIIARKFAELESKREKRERADREAEKLANMNNEQRTKYELDQLKKELSEYKTREARTAMANQARTMLQEKNIAVSDELLSNLVSDNADTTKASVDSFISLFKNAVDKAVKEALKGTTPRTGAATSGLTKEQIMAVTNRAERQRLINENMHLFKTN